MNQIMLTTKPAAASMTQPSKMSELKLSAGDDDGGEDEAAMADPSAQKTVRLSSWRPIFER